LFVEVIDVFYDCVWFLSWFEGLVKVYVGDGIVIDFYCEVVVYFDFVMCELVLEVF